MSKSLEADKDNMKRVGYLYDKICDLDNIKYAIRMASRRKKKHRVVALVLADVDAHAAKIQSMLANKTFVPSPYKIKQIRDGATGKIRTISCPKFYPDQIVHWAVMTPLIPVFSRGMYAHSAGGMPGRGAHRLMKTCRKWIEQDRKNTKYYLKIDISKFYQSVDNDLLKARLRRMIKDNDAMWLLGQIIDSSHGLPIGNYTSVWLSDICLQEFDRFIKQQLGIKYYARYVDDAVMFGRSKRDLHKVRKAVQQYLDDKLKLQLKPNWQVSPIKDRPLDFLGYRIGQNHVVMRRKTALRIRRRVKRIAKHNYMRLCDACAIISYGGILAHCDSYNFRKKHIDPFIDVNEVRKVISRHGKDRKYNRTGSLQD